MTKPVLPYVIALLMFWPSVGRTAEAERARALEAVSLLPKSEAWEKWLEKSGEGPPDFQKLPSSADLPDPLRFSTGGRVTSAHQWRLRRGELLELFQRYVIGTIPAPPTNLHVTTLATQDLVGATLQTVRLDFGPEGKAHLGLELIVPDGKGPFPVFITQETHRRWAAEAVSRGYIGCVYAGADSKDDTESFIAAWPTNDWTKLTRRAWAASRCIDFLYNIRQVDRARIALTGHSRNGKTSLIAAMLDERITAVISSSSGAGGACSYRFFSEVQFGEGIEMITRSFPDWLHPRLRFFAGREDKLPIDQHEMIALIAPRACLISTALNDSVESVWAIEQTYRGAQPVFNLLEARDRLNVRYRPGGHETRAEDIHAYLDWLDAKFSRRRGENSSDQLMTSNYDKWVNGSREKVDPKRYPVRRMADLLKDDKGGQIATAEAWKIKRERILKDIEWSMGEAPPRDLPIPGEYGAEAGHVAALLGRNLNPGGKVTKKSLNFGSNVAGDLYAPAGKDNQKLPAVIWLHPISNARGYVPGYKRGESPHLTLAGMGLVVFAFDRVGNGNRIEEGQNFYDRFPKWSLLGKSVADTRAAVDCLLRQGNVDPSKIFLLGYDIGAKVALHAAALDERVAGVISVAGFTPMRTDTADRPSGGLARWTKWYALEPRLSAFVGSENRVPYDYDEVLASIAPRPVIIVRPEVDSLSDKGDVERCIKQAEKVYDLLGGRDRLAVFAPADYNHFSPELQKQVFEELRKLAGL